MMKVDNPVEPRLEQIALAVSRRSFGRMEAPVAALNAATESLPERRINLRESQSTTVAIGKHDYFTQPKTYSWSEAWELFTDD